MIRFNCPSCGAYHTVPSSDAGKSLNCNACRTQMAIPYTAPPPKPPKPSANEAVEIRPCPKCDARLSVLPADLGSEIGCPSCSTVFTAVDANAPAPPPPKRPTVVKQTEAEDDDDDRPKKKSKRRKKSGSLRDDRYRTFAPHDGVLMMVMSIIGTVLDGVGVLGGCCLAGSFAGLVLSVFVIFKGSMSIREVKNGVMEPGGRVMLEVARGLAVANVLLAVAGVVLSLVVKYAPPDPPA